MAGTRNIIPAFLSAKSRSPTGQRQAVVLLQWDKLRLLFHEPALWHSIQVSPIILTGNTRTSTSAEEGVLPCTDDVGLKGPLAPGLLRARS